MQGAPTRWNIEAHTSLVFILIPGGSHTVGSRGPSEQFPVGAPYVDPDPFKIPTRVEELELEPYFLSKYEVTQAQWERLTCSSPSQFDHRVRPDLSRPTCPVESVSWEEVVPVLDAVGLALPTDVQWEVAYRGGTSTVFPGTDDVKDLFGRENVLDRSYAREMGSPEGSVGPYDDGFPALAPVGSFPPNIFGFHDMVGNVGELCFDAPIESGRWPRPGDGLIGEPRQGRYRLVRGASWSEGFGRARAGYRDLTLKDRRSSMIGIRPARAVTE